MPATTPGKYTLLELVQIILSSMDSDEVNSISDTVESTQVSLILKTLYYELATEFNILENETLFELNPSNDATKPTIMTVPERVSHLNSVKYNVKSDTDAYSNFSDVEYVTFEEFMNRTSVGGRDVTDEALGTVVFTIGGEQFEYVYRNDRAPSIYTDIAGSTLLFDSYDKEVDDTLQKNKTMCTGTAMQGWTNEDTFVPPLSPHQFALYLNKAKVRAFAELKQAQNQEAAGAARRQAVLNIKRNRTINIGAEINRTPKYGRTGPYYATLSK